MVDIAGLPGMEKQLVATSKAMRLFEVHAGRARLSEPGAPPSSLYLMNALDEHSC